MDRFTEVLAGQVQRYRDAARSARRDACSYRRRAETWRVRCTNLQQEMRLLRADLVRVQKELDKTLVYLQDAREARDRYRSRARNQLRRDDVGSCFGGGDEAEARASGFSACDAGASRSA